MAGKTLYNLNVRGKRGNCEETLPSTEYDFIPDKLVVTKNDLVHIQWTGSNTHNNNNDGNSGQGQGGRSWYYILIRIVNGMDALFPIPVFHVAVFISASN